MKLLRHKASDEIPTSPMADIAFLLIIYFMLTITLSAKKGLDFAMPEEADTPFIDPVESVLVEVLPGGALRVDRRAMALEDLLGYLRPKLEANPKKPVILHTHPQASYGAMVTVYDVLRQGKARLGLREEIQVSVPTHREAARIWL